MSVIGKNMLWLLLSQVSTWAISIVTLIVVPRVITDTEFGRASFALTFVSFFGLVALMGSGTFIVKSTARDESLVGPYVFNGVVMKVFVATFLSGCAIGLALVFGYERETVLLVAVCCLAMVADVLNETLVAGLQGRQRMKGPAVWSAVQEYVGAALGLTVLILTKSIVLFGLALAIAAFVPLIANFVRVWPELRGHRHVHFSLWKTIALGGAPFMMWAAVQVVYGTIDIPLLEALASEAEVGWYSLAYKWVSMPIFFAAVVAAAFFPSLSEHGAQQSASFFRLGNQSLRIVSIVGFPAAAGIALVARDLFALLGYDEQYGHALPLMHILALQIPIVGVDIMLATMLVAVDKQRQWVIVGCIAAVLNPLLNLAAIPITIRLFDNGAIGASVITVFTELVMMVGAIRLVPKGILDKATTLFILRCIVASAVMFPCVLLLHDTWLLVQVVVGMIVYVIASMGLRTVSFRTWRQDFLPPHDPAPDVDAVMEPSS